MPAATVAGDNPQGPWVISRGLCRYRFFELPAAAGSQARTVLRNLLLAWAPFDDSRYCVVWRARHALAWAWNEQQVTEGLRLAGAEPAADVWPEALLHDGPLADGWRLVQGVDGFDGQRWQAGVLTASRWWPDAPGLDEWRRWCLSLGGQAEASLPQPEPMPAMWLARPWAEGVGIDGLLSTRSRAEQLGVAAAIVGLVGLSAGQARQAWDAYAEHGALAAERDRMAAAAAPVARVRDRALNGATEVERQARLLGAPLPLEVLQHLSDRLPDKGVLLREFELNGNRLRIALDAGPELSRTALVKDLQAGGWFVDVNETRSGGAGIGTLGFEMNLQGFRPPLSLAPPSSAGNGASPAAGSPARPATPAGNATPTFPLPTGPGGRS